MTEENEQLTYWRIQAADEIERLRKALSETQTQLAYWREIALENQ